MRFLLDPHESTTLDGLVEAARAAARWDLDGVLLRPTPDLPDALVTAAAVAGGVDDVLIAAEADLGERHPLELAEAAAVVDSASGGRLILVVRPVAVDDRFLEALALVRTALTPAPFRFEGRHWRVPARLPENTRTRDVRVRVTPSPARARLEIWATGEEPDAVACHGIGGLAGADADTRELGRRWSGVDERCGAVLGVPRGRRHAWRGPVELHRELLVGRRDFGQDWAVVSGGPEIARDVGRLVRPRVQLHALPRGLDAHWERAVGRDDDVE